ncbi:MAG TPA: MFS transporter, partial [Mycobacterium sp.]|nr:MFS transporter [Mycobacterium sp.]
EDLATPLTAEDSEPPAQYRRPEGDEEWHARQHRISTRVQRRAASQSGLRRYSLGPSRNAYNPWGEPPSPEAVETALDLEIETLTRAVDEHGVIGDRELYRTVGARYWGPGEFRRAMREAMADNRVVRRGRRRVGPPDDGHPS